MLGHAGKDGEMQGFHFMPAKQKIPTHLSTDLQIEKLSPISTFGINKISSPYSAVIDQSIDINIHIC